MAQQPQGALQMEEDSWAQSEFAFRKSVALQPVLVMALPRPRAAEAASVQASPVQTGLEKESAAVL